jgi:hypothetical protein
MKLWRKLETIKEAIRRAHIVGALFPPPERKSDENSSSLPALGNRVSGNGSDSGADRGAAGVGLRNQQRDVHRGEEV